MEYEIANVQHGGPDYAELEKKGIKPQNLLDFSVSINPFPLPRPIKRAVRKSRISAYPDPAASELTAAISQFHERSIDEITPVNGISQGIWLLSYLLSSPGSSALIVGPTYGEYEKYSLLAGSEIIQYRPPESTRFKPEIDKLCRIIQKKKPALTWICNPNNPTGTVLCSDELTEIAKSCEKAGGRLIIDEAYINFMPPETRRTITGKNVITMRSMTKDFSLPGLRLGYITADRKTTDSLKKIQPVWSVNVQAQTAGTAALKTLPIYERQWENLRRAKAGFLSMLEDFDLEIYPGSANFILAKQRQTEAKEWKELLLDAGILVRDCSSFGLPGFVRFGVLRTENNRRFTKELRRLKIWEK